MSELRHNIPELPEAMQHLAIDERGYPVPFFVAIIDGKPDHRVVDGSRFEPAVKQGLCWICGKPLDPQDRAFVLGPMCAITRTVSEPPSHLACCRYAVKACPFLSRPKAERRETGLDERTHEPAGHFIKRNPGVTIIWRAAEYAVFRAGDGILFRVGKPTMVWAYTEGRLARPAELVESINTGLPVLIEAAKADGQEDLLAAQVDGFASHIVPIMTHLGGLEIGDEQA